MEKVIIILAIVMAASLVLAITKTSEAFVIIINYIANKITKKKTQPAPDELLDEIIKESEEYIKCIEKLSDEAEKLRDVLFFIMYSHKALSERFPDDDVFVQAERAKVTKALFILLDEDEQIKLIDNNVRNRNNAQKNISRQPD